MPALPPVPSVIRLRWIGTDAADTAVGSHITYRYSGAAPTSAQLATIAPTIGNLWNTNMAPITSTDFTLTLIEMIDLSSSTGAVAEVPVTHAGTRVGAPVPLNCAFTIGFLTALRRRGGHWHCQLRAGTQTDLADPQHWSGPFATAVTTAWQGFSTGFLTTLWSGASSAQLVGVQYYGPPNRTVTSSSGRVKTVSTLLTTPNVFPTTGVTYRTRIGSQRRRLG